MDTKSIALTLLFCTALIAAPTVPAQALSACEKEAGQCNRQADVAFRQEKKALGVADARKLVDKRRFECRAALRKCGEVKARNRDLRIGGGGVRNAGRLNNPGYSPGGRSN